jgi:hypothetical protein
MSFLHVDFIVEFLTFEEGTALNTDAMRSLRLNMKLEAKAVGDILGRINLDHEEVRVPDHVGPI